jgi:hypothetical protein
LGKNWNKIKAMMLTLNQRVQGSSPCAPTIVHGLAGAARVTHRLVRPFAISISCFRFWRARLCSGLQIAWIAGFRARTEQGQSVDPAIACAADGVRRFYAGPSYFGLTAGLLPGVPGGGIIGIFAPVGGGVCLISGSMPVGGVMTPPERFSSELVVPLAGGTDG